MLIDLDSITVKFDYESEEIYDIKRCVETLLSTPAGTCPTDREFGISNDIDSNMPDVAQNLLAVEITEKIDRYEPRAAVKEISFGYQEDGQMKAEVVLTNG